jgi:hypothetical protein
MISLSTRTQSAIQEVFMISWNSFLMIDGRELKNGQGPGPLAPGNYVPASVWRPGVKLPPGTRLWGGPGLGAEIKGALEASHRALFSGEEVQRFWENGVAEVVKTINTSTVGRAVLDEIQAAGMKVTIKPARNPTACGAKGDPEAKCQPKDDGRMVFSPGALGRSPDRGLSWITSPPYRPDDVLVHELFHKARQARGVACVVPRGDEWHNNEELYAILIANIYLSERGLKLLRGSHRSTFDVLRETADSISDKYSVALYTLQRDMPSFFAKMNAVPCSFNPIRVWTRKENELRKDVLGAR